MQRVYEELKPRVVEPIALIILRNERDVQSQMKI